MWYTQFAIDWITNVCMSFRACVLVSDIIIKYFVLLGAKNGILLCLFQTTQMVEQNIGCVMQRYIAKRNFYCS